MPTVDENETRLVVRRVLEAPASEVYSAWTDPAFLKRWSWGSPHETLSLEQDCRVGGVWRQEIRNKETGERWSFDGVYRELVPGRKLVHTFHWRSDRGVEDGPSLVSIEFVGRGPKTEVIITHTELDPATRKGTEDGWENVLTSVERCLSQPVESSRAPTHL